jgi:ABC-type nitrate/sulfonate/bicarbonate transport system substrate-binding protein
MKRFRRKAKQRRISKPNLIIGILMVGFIIGLLLHLRPSSIGSQGSSVLRTTSPTEEFVLKVNGAISPSSAGVLVALSDGLFQREGLRVQLRHGTDDADVISSVTADYHVIGLASAQAFLKARAEGFPIVAFAASYVLSSVEFFALSNTKLYEPADLEGKRIGYKPDPELSTILRALVVQNAVLQSGLEIVQSNDALRDFREGRIDVLIGRREVEGQELDNGNLGYRSLSPDSFGVHAIGPVYFANERAFESSDNLERFLIAIVHGWDAAYSDYNRTIPIIGRSIDDKLTPAQILHFMDSQRRLLRPSGARFGELDAHRLLSLQDQLLQQRIIQQPLDLSRAINYDILNEVYRAK